MVRAQLNANLIFFTAVIITYDACSVVVQQHCVPFLQIHVAVAVERISMDMLKIEQVIVGSEVRSTSAKIKSEPVGCPLESCKIIFICIIHTPLTSVIV